MKVHLIKNLLCTRNKQLFIHLFLVKYQMVMYLINEMVFQIGQDAFLINVADLPMTSVTLVLDVLT